MLRGWRLWLFVLVGSALCGLALVGAAGADDAVGFQIGQSHVGLQQADALVPPLREAWSVDLPADQTNPRFSYPLIVAGHVFVTGWRYRQPGSLTALELATGSVVWGPIDIGGDGHWSGLTYDAGVVFTVADDGTVDAVDPATGAILWTRALAAGVHAEPAAGGGAVYIATSGSLVALDERDGSVLWSRTIGASTANTPAFAEGQVFVSDGPGSAFAFDVNGTQLWSHPGAATDARAVAVYQGRVYVRDSRNWSSSLILDAASGASVGSFRSERIPAFTGNLAIELNNGVLSAQDLSTGRTAWTFTGETGLSVTPIVVNGYVYTGSWDGELYALDAATGAVVWMAGTANLPGGETDTSAPQLGLAAADGYLVVPVFCQRCREPDGQSYELVAYTTGPGTQSPAAPNDAFSAPLPLAANPGSVGGSDVGAGRETGEPDHAGAAAGHSVWYDWIAPQDGFITFVVRSENVGILTAAYRGASPQSLVEQSSDPGLTAGSPHTSRIQFPVDAARVYHFAVDTSRAVSGSPGTGSFTLDPVFQPADPVLSWTPTNDYFGRALIIPAGVGAADFYSLHATKEAGEPDHAGNAGGSSIWFSWTAPKNGTYTLATQGADFDVLLGVYTGSNVSALTSIAAGAAPTGSHDAAVTFAATAGRTYMFALDGRNGAGGTGELTVASGSSPPPAPTTPETAIKTAPPATTTATDASFSFTSSASGSTFACALDAGPFELCTSPASYSGLALGAHTFRVKAVDPAGTADPLPTSDSWTIEAPPAPPNTTITSTPPATTTATDASFSFTSSGQGSSFVCSLDGLPFTVCSSPTSYSGLALGTHRFAVKAIDPVGQGDPTPATFTWTIDAPPETTITDKPSATTTATDASFSFNSSIAGSSFRCSLDGASLTVCNSPVSYAGLSVGAHTFRVEAIDAAGTADPTPASYSWTIDPLPVPPDTTITSGPASATTATDAAFAFVSSALESTFKCSLDGAAFTPCSSPTSYSGLALAAHTFRVEAIDAAGNVDPSPASFTWTIEPPVLPPPDTTITSGPPASTTATDATFTFSSSAPFAVFACSLDGAAYVACATPATYTGLAVGTHNFRVRAIDTSGTADATPASYSWTVEPPSAPPETTITSSPSSGTTATDATFSFVSSTAGSSFGCSLDSAAFTVCSSPRSYADLSLGTHTFLVAATDASGHTDPTPASVTWTITSAVAQPPETTITVRPPSSTASKSASFSFSSSVPNSSFKCSLDGAAFNACTSPADYRALAPGSHTFRVDAIEPSGTADPTPAEATWTITAQPETPPSAPAKISVRIRGRPVVGDRLMAVAHRAVGKVAYRWATCKRRHCATIRGATRASLRIRRPWLGRRLRVTVIEQAAGIRASATSAVVRARR